MGFPRSHNIWFDLPAPVRSSSCLPEPLHQLFSLTAHTMTPNPFFLLSFEFSFNFVYGLRKHTREQTHFHLLDDRNWENMVNQNRLKHVWPFPPPSNTAWWVLWDCLSVLKDTHHTHFTISATPKPAGTRTARENGENRKQEMKRWYDNDMNLAKNERGKETGSML